MLICGTFQLIVGESGYPAAAPVCFAAALMGLLGFIDDLAKVRGGSEGLKARYKLPAMIITGFILLYLIRLGFVVASATHVMPWPAMVPEWIYYSVGIFLWLGGLNGANFTDGLDGLLSVTSIVILSGAVVVLANSSLGWPAAIGLGALIAFLFFNWKPASLYMGDSGSLAIGALVAGIFLASGWWLFLGLCAFVWVIEVLSVILQVISFRKFGRRIFLMTPIHHHFELAGWKETIIVTVFCLLQATGCLAVFLWLRIGMYAGIAAMTILLLVFTLLLLRYRKRVV